VLSSRKRVREEFDRLVRELEALVAVIEPETSDRTEDGSAAYNAPCEAAAAVTPL